jgi:hypothetical protein
MRNLLESLATKFSRRRLSEITTAEIEVHGARFTGGVRTKNNLIATLKTFFLLAQKHAPFAAR